MVGALFDLNFDHMITTKMVKALYLLALIPYTLLALLVAGYGLDWLSRGGSAGWILLLGAPFLWLFLLLVTRISLEFVINQFKITEYLRAIKDKS